MLRINYTAVILRIQDSVRVFLTRPILFCNACLFFLSIFWSRSLYNGQIMARGDAVILLSPKWANSFFQFLYSQYTLWEGRLAGVAVWGCFQRISAHLDIQSPLDYPYWFPIMVSQFALLGAGLNISIFFGRLLKTNFSKSFYIFGVFIVLWSINPSLFGYTLDSGNGPYPLFTYAFSCVLLAFSGHYSKYKIFLGFALYIFILLGSDVLWGVTVLSIVYLRLTHYEKKELHAFKRIVPVVLLPILSSLFVYYSPGFQKRIAVFSATGATPQFELTVESMLQLFDRYINQIVNNTYFIFYDSYLIDARTVDWFLLHIFLTLTTALMLVIQVRSQTSKGGYGSKFERLDHIFWFTAIFLIGLHVAFMRQLVSNYHGKYANDGPSFLLLSFLVCLAFTLFKNWSSFQNRVVMIVLMSGLFLFYGIPNAALCVKDYNWAKNDTNLRLKAYADIVEKIEQERINRFSLTGSPRPSFDQDLLYMLKWADWADVSVVQAGNPDYKKEIYEIEVIPDLIISRLPLADEEMSPQLIREQIFHGEYIRDYRLPGFESFQFQVNLNPSYGSSSAYLSKLQYIWMSGVTWDFDKLEVGRNMNLNPIGEVQLEHMKVLHPVKVCWFHNGQEVDLLPLNALPILRIKISEIDPLYVTSSTHISFLWH